MFAFTSLAVRLTRLLLSLDHIKDSANNDRDMDWVKNRHREIVLQTAAAAVFLPCLTTCVADVLVTGAVGYLLF